MRGLCGSLLEVGKKGVGVEWGCIGVGSVVEEVRSRCEDEIIRLRLGLGA
jgi:hypothetical protein